MRGIISILKKLKVYIKKGAYQKALVKDVRAHLFHKQEPDPGPAPDLGLRTSDDVQVSVMIVERLVRVDTQVCWSVLRWNQTNDKCF